MSFPTVRDACPMSCVCACACVCLYTCLCICLYIHVHPAAMWHRATWPCPARPLPSRRRLLNDSPRRDQACIRFRYRRYRRRHALRHGYGPGTYSLARREPYLVRTGPRRQLCDCASMSSTCLYACLHMSVRMSTPMPVRVPLRVPAHMPIHISARMSTPMPVYMPAHMSVQMSVHVSVWMSVSMPVHMPARMQCACLYACTRTARCLKSSCS